jgi:hypothetical protein
MEPKQIINYIVSSVKNTRAAFADHDLPYDPQIIRSATIKELKKLDSTVDPTQFDQAIELMKDEGLVDSRGNGLIYFKDKILN